VDDATHLQLLEGDTGNNVVEKRAAAAAAPRRVYLTDLQQS
jgi:hypothetical protein